MYVGNTLVCFFTQNEVHDKSPTEVELVGVELFEELVCFVTSLSPKTSLRLTLRIS